MYIANRGGVSAQLVDCGDSLDSRSTSSTSLLLHSTLSPPSPTLVQQNTTSLSLSLVKSSTQLHRGNSHPLSPRAILIERARVPFTAGTAHLPWPTNTLCTTNSNNRIPTLVVNMIPTTTRSVPLLTRWEEGHRAVKGDINSSTTSPTRPTPVTRVLPTATMITGSTREGKKILVTVSYSFVTCNRTLSLGCDSRLSVVCCAQHAARVRA